MRAAAIFFSAVFFLAALAMLSPTHAADAEHGDLKKKEISALFEKASASPDETVRVIVKLKSAPAKNTELLAAKNTANPQAPEISGALLKGKRISGGDSEFVAAAISLQDLETLASDSRVESISENRKMHAFLSESVPLIGANSVWAKQIEGINVTGAGTSVCIIDTGVDYTHPDLGGCTNETFLAGNCSKVIGGYDFCGNSGACGSSAEDNDPMDNNGHGTHVAGIVAANGTLKGVAPDAKIIAIKALNSTGSGDESDVLAGIYWCVSNATKYNISTISMSLGDGETYSQYCDNESAINSFFAEAINAAVSENISVVVATGNNGDSTGYSGVSSPACIQNATRVTATDKSDNYASFAERGIGFPDILAAPGVNITSTYLNSGQTSMGGTSMSTPHVSGAIALLSEAYRKLYGTAQKPQYFKSLLNSTGMSINDTVGAKINFSRINVLSAYNTIVALIILIDSPKNGTFINRNSTQIIASQNAISWMNYSIDSGDNVSACQNCSNFENYSANITDGLHNLIVYGNNSAVALEYATVWFTTDTIPPAMNFSGASDVNNSFLDRQWIFANLSLAEANPANATFFLFNSSGIVNSTTTSGEGAFFANWTALPEGTYYFNATVFDKAGNSNSSETRQAAIDLSAPAIVTLSVFPPISYPGQNITISYSVSDMTPANSTINITHGAVSEQFNESGGGNASYSLIFSNTPNVSDYEVLISATDSAGHTSNASAQFKIRPRANISFNFVNFTSNQPLSIKIKYKGSEIAGISANASGGKNASFGYENYTVEAHGVNEAFAIMLNGVEFAQDEILKIFFSNISAPLLASENKTFVFTNNSFSFSPDFNRSSATVCFNYTNYAGSIFNLSQIVNFKCEDRCADKNWSAIPTALDSAANTSCSNISSFSSFALGELNFCGNGIIDSGETCASCPADAGTCPVQAKPDMKGSGGYGGGYISAVKAKNITNSTNTTNAINKSSVPSGNPENIRDATNIYEDTKNNSINSPTAAVTIQETRKENKSVSENTAPGSLTALLTKNYLEGFVNILNYLIRYLLWIY